MAALKKHSCVCFCSRACCVDICSIYVSKFLSISLILGVLHGVRPQHSALEVGPYQDWPSLKTAAKNWKTQDGGKRRIHIDLLKSLGQMRCQIFMKHALFCILITYITYIYIHIYCIYRFCPASQIVVDHLGLCCSPVLPSPSENTPDLFLKATGRPSTERSSAPNLQVPSGPKP